MRPAILLCVLLTGCSAIDMHKPPPSDWPTLAISYHKVGFWEMQRHCGTSGPKFLLMQAFGCAWIDFDSMTCRIYYAAEDEASAALVIEHEEEHCRGRDHVGASTLRNLWENWKRGQR